MVTSVGNNQFHSIPRYVGCLGSGVICYPNKFFTPTERTNQQWFRSWEFKGAHPETPMPPQEIRPWIIVRPAISLGERGIGNGPTNSCVEEFPNLPFRFAPNQTKHKVGVFFSNNSARFNYIHSPTWIHLILSIWYTFFSNTNQQ